MMMVDGWVVTIVSVITSTHLNLSILDRCNSKAPGYVKYCNMYSVMGPDGRQYNNGVRWQDRPFTMDAKLVFTWLANSPPIVSTIDWDASTSAYTSCNPSCTFTLQRSDTAALNNSTSAVILLQATHASRGGNGGNRYFVMEHRRDLSRDDVQNKSVLIMHWRDIDPGDDSRCDRNGSTWERLFCKRPGNSLGHSFVTDCNPDTLSWADAGCSPGQSILLDTGNVTVSVKMLVNVSRALESEQLRVTISRVYPQPPQLPLPPPPNPPPPSPSPLPLSLPLPKLTVWPPQPSPVLPVALTLLVLVCAAGVCGWRCSRCNRHTPAPISTLPPVGEKRRDTELSNLLR